MIQYNVVCCITLAYRNAILTAYDEIVYAMINFGILSINTCIETLKVQLNERVAKWSLNAYTSALHHIDF